jgi:hypothetical protein
MRREAGDYDNYPFWDMPKSSPSSSIDYTLSPTTACADTEAFRRLYEEAWQPRQRRRVQ